MLKHGNAAGTSRHGGVLVVAGDDHGCQSSTLPHQSEQVLHAAMIPILNPATVQDYLDFGLLRLRAVAFLGLLDRLQGHRRDGRELGDRSTSIPQRVAIVLPDDFELPPGGLNIRWPDPPLEQERRLHGPKMAAVAAFARANALDRVVLDPPRARLGIVTTGKAYLDVRQALDDLGIDDARARGARHPPLQGRPDVAARARAARARSPTGSKKCSSSRRSAGFIEDQLVRILYHLRPDRRPRVVGKRDEHGGVLLPSEGELSPDAWWRGRSSRASHGCMARCRALRGAARAAAQRSSASPTRRVA